MRSSSNPEASLLTETAPPGTAAGAVRNGGEELATAAGGDLSSTAKAAFFLRMRMRGIQDRAVLRAFERIPRVFFVEEKYRGLAALDVPVPLPCGQTMPEPLLLARMITALGVEPGHHVLEIGAGTGYATAILANMADDVIGVERFQTLARAAQSRLAALEIVNAAIVWGDGLALPSKAGPFDRIIVHGVVTDISPLLERLTPEGRLVCAQDTSGARHAVALQKQGGETERSVVCPCALQPVVAGVAAAL